jgi:cysteine desulfuration protein SufE
MPLPPKLADLIESFSILDRQDRIEALVAIGESYRKPEGVPRDDTHRVPGCESEVYVASEPEGEGRRFLIAVDNPQGISAMALAQILDQTLSGEPAEGVARVPEDIVYEIFGRELSMGKSMGLMNTVSAVKREAANAVRQS